MSPTKAGYRTEIPRSVLTAEGVPIDRAGPASDIADKIRQGRALLKIVSTPWGVDFYVVEVGEGR